MSNRITACELNLTRQNGLCVFKSSDWYLAFKISEQNNLEQHPIDLSGYRGYCNIKVNLNDTTPVAQPSVDCDENGNVICSMPASMTKNFIVPSGNYNDPVDFYYEVILVDSDTDEQFRSLYGKISVIASAFDSDDLSD